MLPQILTPEDLESINSALDIIKGLKAEIKRAQQANIPIDVTLEDLEAQEKQLLSIKRTYFPTGK